MRRGDIFALRLPKGLGHEQRGRRFGVVVQSDAFLPRSVVLVAPTSTSAKPAAFRPEIDLDGTLTRVRLEQVGAVDHQRLVDFVGHHTPEEQWGVDAALLTVLALNCPAPNTKSRTIRRISASARDRHFCARFSGRFGREALPGGLFQLWGSFGRYGWWPV